MRAARVPVGRDGHQAWVRYVDIPGPRPARVYIAGLTASTTATFVETAAHPALARARSVLVDLLGTGLSDHGDDVGFGYTIEEQADVVAALLDQLGEPSWTVIGHSLGGAISISLAHRRPDLVESLLVCEPNLDPGVGTLSAEIAGQSEEEFTNHGYAELVASAQDDSDPIGAAGLAQLRSWSARTLYYSSVSLLADRSPTFREQLKTAPMPRAFLVGDRTDTPEELGDLPSSGIEMYVVPDSGHVMMDDNLDGFAHVLAHALANVQRK